MTKIDQKVENLPSGSNEKIDGEKLESIETERLNDLETNRDLIKIKPYKNEKEPNLDWILEYN